MLANAARRGPAARRSAEQRGAAFGIPTRAVDGMDVLAVEEAHVDDETDSMSIVLSRGAYSPR